MKTNIKIGWNITCNIIWLSLAEFLKFFKYKTCEQSSVRFFKESSFKKLQIIAGE